MNDKHVLLDLMLANSLRRSEPMEVRAQAIKECARTNYHKTMTDTMREILNRILEESDPLSVVMAIERSESNLHSK